MIGCERLAGVRCGMLAGGLLMVVLGLWAGPALAAPGPVDPLEVGRSTLQIPSPEPFVSPTGEQGVVWLNPEPAAYGYRGRWRTGGGAFGPVDELTGQQNIEEPGFSFDRQGRAFVYYGTSMPSGAQYAVREPGSPVGAFRPLTPCGRFVDADVAPDGRVAVGCSRNLTSNPPNTAVLLQSPGLGQNFTAPVSPFGAVYDNFIQPEIAWGGDGRLALTVEMLDVTTSPPPATYTDRLRSYVTDPGNPPAAALFEVDTAPYNSTQYGLSATGTVIAGDGAVVITSESDAAGARVHVRTAGAAAFTSTTLTSWDWAAKPATDAAGAVHAIVAMDGPPYAYGVITRPPGGSFGPVVELASPRPASSYLTDFEVGADGTEYALFSADDGPATVRVRPAGTGAFGTPMAVAPVDSEVRNAALAPTGDLLVAWSREAAAGDFRVHVGGLDSGARPVLAVEKPPARVLAGVPVRFAASASDSMGIRSLTWKFSDGATASGEVAVHAFAAAGTQIAEVTATDRAGNTTSESHAIEVVGAATPDRRPARLRVKGKKKIKFTAFRRRGARYRVRSNEPVRLVAQLIARPRSARISAVGDYIVAERAVSLGRRARNLRLRPKPRLLGRKARNLRLRVRFTATDRSGNTTVLARRLRVRRR